MIHNIESISELKPIIESDLKNPSPSASRYPIRFIFLNSLSTFNKVVKLLSEESNIFYLSEALPHKDGWFTSDGLLKILNSFSSTTLVLPLSETLRFTTKEAFYSILVSIFEIENLHDKLNKRIYIPMLGLWDRFDKDFYSNFHRKKEWAPIWKINCDETNQIQIYQINFPVNTSHNLLKNTSDWLNIWKHDNQTPILSISESLSFLYKKFLPDSIFQMHEVNNYKELISMFFNVNLDVKFYKKEENYWDNLYRDLESLSNSYQINDYISFLSNQFNIKNILGLHIFEFTKLYLESTAKYDRWLLKLFYLTNANFKNSYLLSAILEINSYTPDEFIFLVWSFIFSTKAEDHHYKERKDILNYIHKTLSFPYHSVEKNILSFLKTIDNLSFKDQLKYLTNITLKERIYIIETFVNKQVSVEKVVLLAEIYPELYNYLSWDISIEDDANNEWVKNYFKEYCKSKFLNVPSETLLSILNAKNCDSKSFYNWYYKINECTIINDAELVWIDALGAEWFSLLIFLLNKYAPDYNKYISKRDIVRVNLPSITDVNRFQNSDYINDLDNYIHKKNPYSHPSSLVEQISLIEKIVKEKILSKPADKILIVSDHGFTFLAQKEYGNFKKFDFTGSDHEGRCMWITEEFRSNANFLVHSVDKGEFAGKKCLLSTKFTSMYNTPYREVHGGATPEEILVPCIELMSTTSSASYRVSILTPEISTQLPVLSFIIYPNPNIIPILLINGKEFKLSRIQDKWSSKAININPGTHLSKIIIGAFEHKFFLKFKGGFEEEELF